ncbi:uncharacterized protein LOC134328784 [Trichomycterus rosablanca]|uniref:uncharacterized protein LOC134328784 n=1 Tax=Trichomycterus rosablanca TaxID=2290929 RepID=UPI002F35EA0F
MKSTTVRSNLMSLKKFFDFLSYVPRMTTKLNGVDFIWLWAEIARRLRDIQRDVTCHRQAVRKGLQEHRLEGGSALLPEGGAEDHFRQDRIPEGRFGRKSASSCFGLLAGYFISMSGHRAGVMKNLKVDEVMDAEVGGDRVTINVQDHKSASMYGHAQLSLTQEELQWLEELVVARDVFPGSDSPHLFFNASGGRCKKFLNYFQTEWSRMGFGGSYTFRNLRTSMVHHTKNLSPRKRLSVHRAMCHSEAVVSKFYLPLNTVQEAAEVRRLQEGEESPEERPHSSGILPGTSSPATRRRVSR